MLISLGMSAVLAVGITASGPTHENPELKRAEAAVANLRYEEALAAISRARAARGNDRATLLRILELQGVVAGQLRRSKIAESAFRELLVLDPDHHLAKDYAPRVMTPFYEAKRLVAEKGALTIRAADPEITAGEVHTIGVQIDSDPLAMARAVRFHWRAGAGDWHEVIGIPMSGKARIPATGSEVTWWAELVGDQDGVLALVSSAEAPRVERPGGAPPVGTPPTNPEIVLVPPPPPMVSVAPEPGVAATSPQGGTSGARVGSYLVLGGAVVAGGLGGYFGYQSQQDNSAVQKALQGGQNPVTGMTEKTANDLNNQSKQYATVANVLFATAGVFAVGGVLLWWLGGNVTVSPSPTGATISGSF